MEYRVCKWFMTRFLLVIGLIKKNNSMKYHISSSLFVLFCIVLCACNSSSVEKDGRTQPAFDLIERQIGERAAGIQLEEIAPENGKETFEVEAKINSTLRGRSLGGYLLCVPD